MTYASLEEGQAAMRLLWESAEAAGVPWSYQMSARVRADDEYRRWLAHEYVCRAVGVDPRDPPAILGVAPFRPNIDQGDIERDLDALADFSLRPFYDFSAQAPLGLWRGTNGDRPVPSE